MTDIAKILENAPKGIKLYSPAYGYVELVEAKNTPYCDGTLMATEIKTKTLFSRKDITFDFMGRLSIDGECMLFPGTDGTDWDSWQRCIMPQSEGSYVVDCYGGVFRIRESGWSIEDSGGNVFEMSPEEYCKGGNGFRYATKEEVEFFENNEKKNIRSILKCDNCNESKKGVCIRQCEDRHINWWPAPKGNKFDEGDWIVRDDMELDNPILHIDFVSDDGTKYSFDGDYGFSDSKYIDWNYHKWTIFDARPGDILRSGHFIFVFKKVSAWKVVSFCDCHNDDTMILNPRECEYLCEHDACFPATEEEKKKLLTVLRRNDYIWDSEELCLKSVVNVRMTDGGTYDGRGYVMENPEGQFELSQFEALESAEKWRDSLDARKISVMSVLDAYAEGMQAGYRKAFIDRMNNVKL